MSKIFTYYFFILFIIIYTLTFPFQLVLLQKKSWFKYAHLLTKMDIKILFFLCNIKIQIINENILKNNKNAIFCSNHSSYIDILSSYFFSKDYFKFIGKKSLEKIPFFGYMYKKLHINFDRRNKDSRGNILIHCKDTLEQGINILIYPEGAIPVTNPKLIYFKNGAFQLSIETKTPIIPITMPFNHKILPVKGSLNNKFLMKIIIHKPLNTLENPIESISELRDKTFKIINNELLKHRVL